MILLFRSIIIYKKNSLKIKKNLSLLLNWFKKYKNMSKLKIGIIVVVVIVIIGFVFFNKNIISLFSTQSLNKNNISTVLDSFNIEEGDAIVKTNLANITNIIEKLTKDIEDTNNLIVDLENHIVKIRDTKEDISALETLLVDFKDRITTANINIENARNIIMGLSPDGGDEVKTKENMNALSRARLSTIATMEDIIGARRYARQIMNEK